MNNQGWISVHRKILDNPIFQDHDLFILFMFILLTVNHEKKTLLFNGEVLTINEGEMITGRNSLAEKLNMKPSQIYKKLKLLEKLGICNIKSNNKFSIINVVKWSEYQNEKLKSSSKKNNKVTTKEQQSNTNNNDNNDNNENNISKDIRKPSQKKPDLRITEIVKHLENKIGMTLDGSIKSNRQYTYNLIRKLEKLYPDLDLVLEINRLVDMALEDPFHKQNLTSIRYLYYNFGKIVNQFKKKSKSIAII